MRQIRDAAARISDKSSAQRTNMDNVIARIKTVSWNEETSSRATERPELLKIVKELTD